MSDIFDELSRGQPDEVGMELSQIFAPEFLDAYDAQALKAAFGGLAKVMKSRSHPDFITNVADQAVVEKWRKNQHSEDPDVIEFNEHLLNGAALVDEFKKLEEQLEKDPVGVRMAALLAIRQQRGYVPSKRKLIQSKAEEIEPQQPNIEGLPEDIEAWRERQRALIHAESLTNVGEALVLSRVDNKAFLFHIEGRENRANDKADVKVQELELLKPKKTITSTWVDEALRRNSGMETELDGKYAYLEVEVEGGLFAKFNLTGPDANIGRTALVSVLDEVNPQIYGDDENHDYHPYNYQLAIKDADDNYQFIPTVRGFTAKKKPLAISSREFNDWAVSTYGELPDVFYVVNQGQGSKDRRVIFAYANTSIETDILSPETFGLKPGADEASFYVQPLGFVHDIAKHQAKYKASNQNLLTTPADKKIGSEGLVELEDDSDVLLLSGIDNDFIARKKFHHRTSPGLVDESGLVLRVYKAGIASNEQVEEDIDAEGDVEWTKVYAIKSPAVIGVTKASYTPNKALLEKWDEQTLEDLGEQVKQAMKKSAQEIIDENSNI